MNCDNFLGDRPSTRVHAPPGGASSFNIFGGYDEPAAKPTRPVAAAAAAPAPRTSAATETVVESKESKEAPSERFSTSTSAHSGSAPVASAGAMRVSSNAFASNGHQNSGNFITDRSTTRLHAPPGGKSSFSFGWS